MGCRFFLQGVFPHLVINPMSPALTGRFVTTGKPLNTLDWSQQIPRLAQIQGERDFTFWWEELQNCIAKGSRYREVKCCGHFLSSITTTWQACLLGQITSLLYVMVSLYLKHKIHKHTYTAAPQRSKLQPSHVNQTSYVKIL